MNYYEEGGAVPDDEEQDIAQDAAEDNTPAAAQSEPAIPDGQQGQQDQGAATLGGDRPWYEQDNGMLPINAAKAGVGAVAGGASRILHYLMGADSADPESAEKFALGVKAEHPGISDDDANVIAVHKATEMGGPAAGWAMIQYNRSAYDRKQAFAKAALNGIDGKAGDLQAAADAATKAAQNVLDGSQTTFTADPGSGYVTATVKPAGSNRTVNYSLTPQQFDQYLDVGGAGQWDHVMSGGGIPGTLQKIVGTTRAGAPSTNARDLTPEQNKDKSSTQSVSSSLPDQYNDNYVGDRQYPDWLEARADARFGHAPGIPMLGPAPQNLQDRIDWENQQEQPYETRKAQILAAQAKANASMYNAGMREQGYVNAARERAGGQVGAANARADATRYAADQRNKSALAAAQLAAAKMAAQAKNEADRQKAMNMRNEVNALARTSNPDDPEFENKLSAIQQKWGLAPTSVDTQVPTPQTAPTNNAPAQNTQTVPPPAQRVTGQVYKTPKGSFKWMGNGWQPAQ